MRTYLIRAVLALAVVLAVSGPAAAQSVVRGKVVDAQGKPVEGAVVTIEATEANRKAQTKTNRNGEFLQVGLASGRYNVTVTKDNLKAVQPANVSQGTPVELTFQLTPSSGLTPEQAKDAGGDAGARGRRGRGDARRDATTRRSSSSTRSSRRCRRAATATTTWASPTPRSSSSTEAETSFKKAIELAPNSGDAYTGLANVYNATEEVRPRAAGEREGRGTVGRVRRRRRRRGVLQPGRDPVERRQVRRGQGAVRSGGQGRPEHGDGALPARDGQPEPRPDSGGEGGVRGVPEGGSERPEGGRGPGLRQAAPVIRVDRRPADRGPRAHCRSGPVGRPGPLLRPAHRRLQDSSPRRHPRGLPAGQRDFGENRVQEGLQKIHTSADLEIRWHLLGHLQTNKARKAGAAFATIQSVDSVELLQKLDLAAGERGPGRSC